jgi:branched-chain amino acid transport system permease protein
MSLFYAFLGTAWNIVGGYVGLVSLGHAAYFGLGAYISTLAFLNFGVTPWLGILLAAVGATFFGFAIGVPSIRFWGGGAFFCVVSIAFAETLRLVFLGLKIGGGSAGTLLPIVPSFVNFEFESKLPYYFIILGFLVVELLVLQRISVSKMGHYLVAIREDEVKAEAVGIDTRKYKLLAIGLSAFFTAIGGVFYAQYVLYFDPYTVFGLNLSIFIVLVATVGGRGTILGPVLGSFIITPISLYSNVILGGSTFQGLSQVVYGVLLILIVLTVPAGLMALVTKALGSVTPSEKDFHKGEN